MKRIILILCINSIVLICSSQVISDISQVPLISRGKIILKGGHSMDFENLSISNDTAKLTNSYYGICRYPGPDISEIYFSKNRMVEMGLGLGLVTLVGYSFAILTENTPEERQEYKGMYILVGAIGTGVMVVAGGIAGAFMQKDKLIYRNSTSMSFRPTIMFDKINKPLIMLSCIISIN